MVEPGVLRRAEEFDAAWARGDTPDIEAYLDGIGRDEREALVRWLVRKDVRHRRARGLPAEPADYAARFPDLAAAVEDVFRRIGPAPPADGPPPGPFFPVAIPGLELLSLLGEGGQGAVYKARETATGQVVAVKVGSAGGRARDRFRAEAESAARLRHPGIVRVMAVGDAQGLPFLRMEFVDGPTLRDLRERGPVPAGTAADIARQVADAMDHAHGRGVIHRDLKPGNVLLDPAGRARVTDFGLAKDTEFDRALTATAAALGTPGYMAPEQADGSRTVDARADVYGIGGILYYLLAGVAPYSTTPAATVRSQVLADRPTPPSELAPGVPPALEAICLKCLARDPGARYQSAGQVAFDLAAFLDGRVPPYLFVTDPAGETGGPPVSRSMRATWASIRGADRTARGRFGGAVVLGVAGMAVALALALVARWAVGTPLEGLATLRAWTAAAAGVGALSGAAAGLALGLPPTWAGHWVRQRPVEWLVWQAGLLLNVLLLLTWPALLARWLLSTLADHVGWLPPGGGWDWVALTIGVFLPAFYIREIRAVRSPRAVAFTDRIAWWWAGRGFQPGRPLWVGALLAGISLGAAVVIAVAECAVFALLFRLNNMSTGLSFWSGTAVLWLVAGVPLWVHGEASAMAPQGRPRPTPAGAP